METLQQCQECGTLWQDGITCTEHFHQMLFWESEYPEIWEVHHLMVLTYHIQHPGLYSPDGLRHSLQLLDDFVAHGIAPAQVRQSKKEQVNSKNRNWKITARPDAKGSYERPVHWKMTAADVVTGGIEHYIENVKRWAKLAHEVLQAEGIL